MFSKNHLSIDDKEKLMIVAADNKNGDNKRVLWHSYDVIHNKNLPGTSAEVTYSPESIKYDFHISVDGVETDPSISLVNKGDGVSFDGVKISTVTQEYEVTGNNESFKYIPETDVTLSNDTTNIFNINNPIDIVYYSGLTFVPAAINIAIILKSNKYPNRVFWNDENSKYKIYNSQDSNFTSSLYNDYTILTKCELGSDIIIDYSNTIIIDNKEIGFNIKGKKFTNEAITNSTIKNYNGINTRVLEINVDDSSYSLDNYYNEVLFSFNWYESTTNGDNKKWTYSSSDGLPGDFDNYLHRYSDSSEKYTQTSLNYNTPVKSSIISSFEGNSFPDEIPDEDNRCMYVSGDARTGYKFLGWPVTSKRNNTYYSDTNLSVKQSACNEIYSFSTTPYNDTLNPDGSEYVFLGGGPAEPLNLAMTKSFNFGLECFYLERKLEVENLNYENCFEFIDDSKIPILSTKNQLVGNCKGKSTTVSVSWPKVFKYNNRKYGLLPVHDIVKELYDGLTETNHIWPGISYLYKFIRLPENELNNPNYYIDDDLLKDYKDDINSNDYDFNAGKYLLVNKLIVDNGWDFSKWDADTNTYVENGEHYLLYSRYKKSVDISTDTVDTINSIPAISICSLAEVGSLQLSNLIRAVLDSILKGEDSLEIDKDHPDWSKLIKLFPYEIEGIETMNNTKVKLTKETDNTYKFKFNPINSSASYYSNYVTAKYGSYKYTAESGWIFEFASL